MELGDDYVWICNLTQVGEVALLSLFHSFSAPEAEAVCMAAVMRDGDERLLFYSEQEFFLLCRACEDCVTRHHYDDVKRMTSFWRKTWPHMQSVLKPSDRISIKVDSRYSELAYPTRIILRRRGTEIVAPRDLVEILPSAATLVRQDWRAAYALTS